MTNRDRVEEFIRRFPGRDDDEISKALAITPREQINQICRVLCRAGLIERRTSAAKKIANFPSLGNSRTLDMSAPAQAKQYRNEGVSAETEWFWEGNVVDSIATLLILEGWKIVAKANTRTRERGFDLHARRGDEELIIEAKGYPGTRYSDPRRAGEVKRTSPSLQSQHWFAQALLTALRLRKAHPEAAIAIGLPDFAKYRTLLDEIGDALTPPKISIILVSQDGSAAWLK